MEVILCKTASRRFGPYVFACSAKFSIAIFDFWLDFSSVQVSMLRGLSMFGTSLLCKSETFRISASRYLIHQNLRGGQVPMSRRATGLYGVFNIFRLGNTVIKHYFFINFLLFSFLNT